MESLLIKMLLGINPCNGNTIFHDIAHDGSMLMLLRLRSNFIVEWQTFARVINNNGESCIHVAASLHRGEIAIRLLRVLVELGADLNAKHQMTKCTVLHIAVWNKDFKLAKWLCRVSFFEMNEKDMDGNTAYQMAHAADDQRMMKILRVHGADCSTPSDTESDNDNLLFKMDPL